MAAVIIIDITLKSESLISKFRSEGHTVCEVRLVNDVVSECADTPGERVLIWHVSSSKIIIDGSVLDISLRNIGNAVKILDSCDLRHKFGVTDNDASYKQGVSEAWTFDSVESWDKLKDRFKKGLREGIEREGQSLIAIKNYILHLFLPLDLDMQALEMIKDDKEKVKKYLWGDSGNKIEGMFQNRKDNEHYRKKLSDLWSKVDELTKSGSINNINDLRKLVGLDNGKTEESQIYKFLESLDTCKEDDKNVTVAPLCNPFKEWKINDKEINSFHDWYCALAGCLKGGRACKD